MAEQRNGFRKGQSPGRNLIYVHEADGTVVTAEQDHDGTWSVTAFVGENQPATIAEDLQRRSDAVEETVAYLESYLPERSDATAASKTQNNLS